MKFKYWITCAVLKTLLYLFCFSELDLIHLSLFFRVQTLTSNTNPRTPSPAGSISPWPPMTPCPCRRRPTRRICPVRASALLKRQRPESLLDCSATASASPPSLSTWRAPQRCRISRGMFLTLSCQAAKHQPITNAAQKPGPLGWDSHIYTSSPLLSSLFLP